MSDRFVRQRDLVPTERLQALTATVIGVGAIGRQVALQLAALGVRHLQLIDFDVVEPTNVSTQGYYSSDIGISKVTATAQVIQHIDPTIRVTTVVDRFRPRHEIGSAVFCCVDSIATRDVLWRSIRKTCEFWCDARMLGEVMRVLTVAGEIGHDHYPTTLFAATEAQSGRCTAHSTNFTGSLAASFMLHQFTRWLRGISVERDLTLNLLAGELTVA